MNKKIDVLLATYNGEKYLKEQIDSILNQTFQNINLIVSDDCSKDDTKRILENYAKKDKRVILYFQKKNLGVVKNIEFLLQQVKSEFYMLADQDDIWLPEKIQKSYETMEKENAALVFGDLEVVDANLNTIYPSFGDYMLLNKKINKYLNSIKLNYLYNCITGCTILAKTETIKNILPIPTTSKFLIHDHWIGIITSCNYKLAYMPEKYIKYRQHGNNQVGTNKVSHGFEKLEQVREHFIKVKLGIFETYVQNNMKFPEDIQKLNIEAFKYFNMIQGKKYFNFRKWKIYNELYKTENIKYYIMNFVIMNLPVLGKPVFKLRYLILKILGKRK